MKLSIITVNLNNCLGLKKTIQSVIDQSFKDYEYIIIDGNSNDGSIEIINKNNENLAYWVSELDSGIYSAMNKGIKQAKGDYCLFLNSGDWLYSCDILEYIFSLERTTDILYGNSIMYTPQNIEYLNEEPEILTFHRFFSHSICHQAMFIKRNLFSSDRFGLYRENLRIVSDWEFNIRAIVLGGCTTDHLSLPVVYVDNTGISLTNRELSLKEREIILNELISDKILADYKNMIELQSELLKIKRSFWYRVYKKLGISF